MHGEAYDKPSEMLSPIRTRSSPLRALAWPEKKLPQLSSRPSIRLPPPPTSPTSPLWLPPPSSSPPSPVRLPPPSSSPWPPRRSTLQERVLGSADIYARLAPPLASRQPFESTRSSCASRAGAPGSVGLGASMTMRSTRALSDPTCDDSGGSSGGDGGRTSILRGRQRLERLQYGTSFPRLAQGRGPTGPTRRRPSLMSVCGIIGKEEGLPELGTLPAIARTNSVAD